MKKKLGRTFIIPGTVFLVIGLVQQEFTLSFKSGMFNLGIIFVLSGIVANILHKNETT
jgi:hypothetical protein